MVARPIRRSRRRKTISAQGVKGQQGINLIESVVLAMGSRWTPSGPNEIGIDGYIELFDPNSHQSLGITVAVQSKVVNAIAENSNPTFDYWCDRDDLEYWLNGNTPVVLIVSDLVSLQAFWVSIRDYFKEWTAASPTRVTFVKSQQRFTQDCFPQLSKVGAPKSGLYLAPSRHQETLHTNLLPLRACPPTISIAGTECRTPRDVWTVLRETNQEVDAGWLLWEKKIFSFHDLGKGPWSSVCDLGTLEAFSTTDWSESDDPQRQRIFVQLLNQTLKAQLNEEVRYWPKEDCYAILGRPRKLSYQSLRRMSKITVISQFSSQSADGRTFQWLRHVAFRGQFRLLEGQWCLEITPTYRFTHDGFGLDRFHEDRLKGIKRIEGNRAVLSSILFWADYLQPKATLFDGDPPPLQFGSLLTFPCNVGIVDKAWLSADPEFARDTALYGQKLLLPDFEDGADQ
jgi:Domain of unknown function (DUF4365)